MRVAAELWLHADHQIEEFFSLHDLSHGLPADGGGNHAFHIGDVDSVACDLFAAHVHQQTWLAQLAHDRQIAEATDVRQSVLDLNCLVLEDVQVLPIHLHRQRTLQARKRLVHRIFGGLGVIEHDPRESSELLADRRDQFGFGANLPTPGFVAIGLESDVKLTIEEPRSVRAIVRTAMLGAHHGHLRIGQQDVANLR